LTQNRLNSATGAKRATIAAAIRYVFIDKDERHDELLAPIIADFTKLLDDSDPVSIDSHLHRSHPYDL
jgi:cullin-associated NEDD8-dissociated protein 1